MARRIRMPSISFIVARSYPDNVIGCENELPWKLKTDLKRFKEITKNHVIVMGRKTFDSIGRPLPDRINIVLSRDERVSSSNVKWVKNIESAILLADFYTLSNFTDKFFVIGGADIYKRFEDRFDKIYLTEVFSPDVKGDAFFNYDFDDKRKFKIVTEQEVPKSEFDEFPSRFSIFERRNQSARFRLTSDFLTKFDAVAISEIEAKIEKKEEIESSPQSQNQLSLIA
uniref:dihydrofolate reductase n=1 Tax=Pararhizobium sp. IMCC3301 TaxID=3067904 RepID=UPI00274122D1|nr:dihydrofolate reductase [Pararhizobium sp. IMCC3301]